MPAYTFTSGGDSAFASLVKAQTGGDWSTIVAASAADSVVDLTTSDLVLLANKSGSNWNLRRGFLYFDLSSLPAKISGMHLQKMVISTYCNSRTIVDTNGDKFRVYALSPTNSGFDPVVGDYDGFIAPLVSEINQITATGADKEITITRRPLLRFIENRINRKAGLYLMTRPLLGITDTDPAGLNRLAIRDPKNTTPSNRPVITLYFVPSGRSDVGGRGKGFGGLSMSAAGGTGFGSF